MAVSDYSSIFEDAGREWDIDPRVLRAVAQQESGGNPKAVSKAGAQGVMQIMPDTAKYLGVTDPHDPQQSIYGGAKYLSEMFDRFKNPGLALAAYNAGPERVDDYVAGRRALPNETAAYVPAVASHYQELTKPLVLGDSIADGIRTAGKLPGVTTVGANPADVLKTINDPALDVKGRDIVLSGGASNDPAQAALIGQQIAALKAKGAANVTVLGVGTRSDFAGVNDNLAAIAAKSGAKFASLDPTNLAPDGVHPANYKTALASLSGSDMPTVTVAAKAPAKPVADSGVMSDDDFLKRTASPAATPKVEDDAAFMARTGAVAPKPAPPPSPALADVISSPDALAADLPQSQTPNPALGRIANAVTEGFKNTPPILTPDAQAAVDQGGPVGRYIVNPALRAVGGGLAVGNALASGAAQTVNETTNALGAPALGRDLNMLAQVAPVASMGAGVPIVPRGVQEAAPAPRFVQEYYGEGTPQNPLSAAPALAPPAFVPPGINLPPVQPRMAAMPGEAPAFIPPDAAPNPLAAQPVAARANPLATGAEPTPQSLGAASRDTSSGPLPTLTRGQERADLMKSVTQTAEDRAGPQGVDHTVYVPGVQRSLAGREFSPQNAVDEKVLRETDQAFDARLKGIEKANNETMVDHYRAQAGDDIAIENAENARDAITPPALKLFEKEKPVDAQPVVDAIDQILAGPAGKRSSVVSVLKDVRAKMFGQDGELETLPSQLYGARQNITDKLRSAAKGTSDEASNARLARSELQSVLEQLDPVIGQGAQGFEAYLKDFSEASKPIDAMRYLQSQLTGAGKITDAQGYLRYNQVQKLLEKVAKDRAASGTNAAKSLTPENIQAIIDIRNELAANAYKDRLASAKGSDTMQKASGVSRLLASPAGVAAKTAATLGAHALLAVPTGGIGNALLGAYQFTRPVRDAKKAARAAADLDLRKQNLLNTHPPTGTP